MAYTPRQRASALKLVAAQGYQIAAGMTGISESSLRQWAKDAALIESARRDAAQYGLEPRAVAAVRMYERDR